jgi:hypothetical protein
MVEGQDRRGQRGPVGRGGEHTVWDKEKPCGKGKGTGPGEEAKGREGKTNALPQVSICGSGFSMPCGIYFKSATNISNLFMKIPHIVGRGYMWVHTPEMSEGNYQVWKKLPKTFKLYF